jgi:serine/threonine protein kinase
MNTIIGQTIGGHYKIIKSLGKGGFGETYLAGDTHLPDNPYRVVKKLKPQSTNPDDLEIAQRLFNTEAQTLYKLGTHNQIPQLFAHFEENQEFYLVQEYIEGHDLTKEIKPGKPLDEPQVIEILQEILTVLDFVHQKNVIHRDIKPANLIRRNSDNKIILIDFGAVKQITSQSNYTIPIGTPGYIPSEQLRGQPQLCSDIYAVGIVAIEALTGIQPHQLPTNPDTGEITWRNSVSVTPELANILDKMIRHHFRYRYQSATEVLQDLKSITRQINSSPTIPSFPPQSSPLSQIFKPKSIILMSLGVIASLIMAIILSFYPFSKPQNQPNSPPVITW